MLAKCRCHAPSAASPVSWASRLALNALGEWTRAIARLQAVPEIGEQIEGPAAERRHAKLAEWGGEGFG